MLAVVLITCPSGEVAREIANMLLRRRLAACVSIIPGIKSLFWWEGRVEEEDEALLIVKTRVELLRGLEEAVKEAHPYKVPEILALPAVFSSMAYLDWVVHETSMGGQVS
ncbi:MAG TPA: divalent-cation tolerance protein CutA [Candidatus Bathyarchaeota archaeon]|nr:divalent-cation tolerance protein CutA [Candidatus Bathyarchaeota archaeon]